MVPRLVLVILAAVVFAPSPGFAQELAWQRLAFAGAQINAVAVADDGTILYVATELGLQVTEDGGESWLYAGQGLDEANAPPVQALAVSPSDARAVFAGTAPGDGAGLYQSVDMGRTWDRIWAGRRDDGIRAILVSPDDPRYITAIAVAHEGKDDELIGSDDGGGSWSIRLGEAGWQSQKLYDLASEPGDSRVAYAAGTQGILTLRDSQRTWSRLSPAFGGASAIITFPRYPGIIVAAGPQDLYVNDNHEVPWVRIPGPELGVCEAHGRDGLAWFGESQPALSTLLVATYSLCAGHYGHIYALGRSTDGGMLWRQMDTGLPSAESLRVLAVGKAAPRAYALTPDGLWTADLAPLLAIWELAAATPKTDDTANESTVAPPEDAALVDAGAVASDPPVEPETATPAAGAETLIVVIVSLSGAATLGLLMVSRQRRARNR